MFSVRSSSLLGRSCCASSRYGCRAFLFCALGSASFLLMLRGSARAADGPAAPQDAGVQQTFSYFLFGGGGFLGVACTMPILMMSVTAVALMIELALTIRRSVLIPPGLAEELHTLMANGSVSHAEQQCKLRPSFLSQVVLAGLEEVRLGYVAVEKAMEDAGQGQLSRLARKIDFLSVAANISTMLGLFGTVVGLVVAFKTVADTQGMARASDLAGGIYLALMTTVEGLIIAIPSVAAHAVFRHRAEQLAAETALAAEYVFAVTKRDRLARRASELHRASRSGTGA